MTSRNPLNTLICRALIVAVLASFSASARVLDDFNDNVKTGWSDFTFNPALGPSQETSGQLRFELPPVQAIFIASQKTSEEFELKEGRTVEFRVDVAQTGGKDSFAYWPLFRTRAAIPPARWPVMGFPNPLPTSSSPRELTSTSWRTVGPVACRMTTSPWC